MGWTTKARASAGGWMAIVFSMVIGIHPTAGISEASAQARGVVFAAQSEVGYERVHDEKRWCVTFQQALGRAYPDGIVIGSHDGENRHKGYAGGYVRYCLTSAQADSASTAILAPIADAYVTQENPDANYGRNIALRTDASPDIRSYLRFDSQRVNGTVLEATLRVYANTASNAGYDARAVSDSDWTESSLTYANAPAMGARMAASGVITAETWTEVDVTAFAANGGLFEVVLTTTGNTAANYSSREGANPPELIIRYIPAPPTATFPPTNMLAPTERLVLTPAADGYVHAENPEANYGTSPSLRVDASPEIYSYVRFEPSGLSEPIVRATLRLFALSASSADFSVHRVSNQAWDEDGLTFSNAPLAGEVVASSAAVSAETWMEIDITGLVLRDSSLDLFLTTTGNTATRFSSREGVNPPELVIEFVSSSITDLTSLGTPAPLPTAMSRSVTPSLAAVSP